MRQHREPDEEGLHQGREPEALMQQMQAQVHPESEEVGIHGRGAQAGLEVAAFGRQGRGKGACDKPFLVSAEN